MTKDIAAYYEYLRTRLSQKKYKQVEPPPPLQMAFFKHGALNIPYVIGVKDARKTTDSPKKIVGHVEEWFSEIIGNSGSGLIMFVYDHPLATAIEEIEAISGRVYAGAHDLFTGRHWVSGYWEQDLYDD